MAIELYDGVNGDGLFQLQGKAFKAQKILDTARLTTIPDAILAVFTQFAHLTLSLDLVSTLAGITTATESWKSGGNSLEASLQAYCSNLLQQMANADTPLSQVTLANALNLLISQMIDNSQSVDACTITLTVTAGTNAGNGVIVMSKKRGDGLIQQNVYAETLTVTVNNVGSPATASIGFVGIAAAASFFSEDWPAGSGVNQTIQAVSADASLLTNGNMETDDDQTNKPDDWILSVGTPGTHMSLTTIEQQTVAISGSPASGYYVLNFTNKEGKVQTTGPLAYNATASDVQNALRLLIGLESVEVSSTGTTPNYTHTVVFEGYGGNVTQLTSTSFLNTGSIAHNTTVAGTSQVFAGGRAAFFTGDGSNLTTLNQQLTGLTPNGVYAFSGWFCNDSSIAAGVITIDLVDGIGGTVIADDQGVNNSFTFNASGLSGSFQHISVLTSSEVFFRLPTVLPPLVFLRIRVSTAVTSSRKVFIDHVSLVAATELYRGGPYVAAFSGYLPWSVGDSWSVAVANNYGGKVQGAYNRNFNMAQLGLLLPYSGSPTIPDSVMT